MYLSLEFKQQICHLVGNNSVTRTRQKLISYDESHNSNVEEPQEMRFESSSENDKEWLLR